MKKNWKKKKKPTSLRQYDYTKAQEFGIKKKCK